MKLRPKFDRGLNVFVGKFSLPVLLFLSLTRMDLSQVRDSNILSSVAPKFLIFKGISTSGNRHFVDLL
jgi:hypothetical protein